MSIKAFGKCLYGLKLLRLFQVWKLLPRFFPECHNYIIFDILESMAINKIFTFYSLDLVSGPFDSSIKMYSLILDNKR